ncbi:hypothetical protein [Streptomyces niger]|uniref:hypothetical protein n=1 Tax=Streptomyces niger TaxID=66373 RepID=UPI000699F57F|nr:hypothetical protein [Streptomyces niger]
MTAQVLYTSYGPCLLSSQPSVTSGTRTSAVTGVLSCQALLTPTTDTFTITWNTGQTSAVRANVQSSLIEGTTFVVLMTGTVPGGLFRGSTFTQTNTGTAGDLLNCLSGSGGLPGSYPATVLTIG